MYVTSSHNLIVAECENCSEPATRKSPQTFSICLVVHEASGLNNKTRHVTKDCELVSMLSTQRDRLTQRAPLTQVNPHQVLIAAWYHCALHIHAFLHNRNNNTRQRGQEV